jgi:hypothetical protein
MSTDEESGSDALPLSINEFHLIAGVERVVQLDNWDCGVACCETVLRSRGRHEPTREQLVATISRSPWTVDFALALHHECNVRCTLFTTQASATHEYAELDFYKATFRGDEERVNAAFARAKALDVPICVRSVPLDELLDWLVAGSLVIALVDARFLRCVCCDDERAMLAAMLPSAELAHRLAAPAEVPTLLDRLLFPHKALPADDDVKGYAGHYIVVCGFHRALRLVFYANPNDTRPELCAATLDVFDRARKQFGTDEDLIRVACAEDDEPQKLQKK